MRNSGYVGQADDQFLPPGPEVDPEYARVLGGQISLVPIRDARVAISGPHVVEPAEIGGHGPAAVGTDRVDRVGDGPLGTRLGVQDVADEMVALAIVP